MKQFYFTAKTTATVSGVVTAESEEKAISLIESGNVDDIFDETLNNGYSDIEITGKEDE